MSVIKVNESHIEDAMRRNENRCMIVEAIKSKYPDATHVKADLATIRFSRQGERYLYITPIPVVERLVQFDRADPALKPFKFELGHPFQVHQARANAKRTDYTRSISKKRGKPPIKNGGRAPRVTPKNRLLEQLGRNRAYGRKLIPR